MQEQVSSHVATRNAKSVTKEQRSERNEGNNNADLSSV